MVGTYQTIVRPIKCRTLRENPNVNYGLWVMMYQCGSSMLIIFKRRLLRVPWTARRSNQSILKEISPEYSLKRLMLKLKFQYYSHLMQRTDSLEKTDAGKDWRQEEKGMTKDETVGWHHWLNGQEFEQALGVGDGQRSLMCCSLWGCKELKMTKWLNWTELMAETNKTL